MTSSKNEKWSKLKIFWLIRQKTFQWTKNISMKKLENHFKSHNWYFFFLPVVGWSTGKKKKYQLWLLKWFSSFFIVIFFVHWKVFLTLKDAKCNVYLICFVSFYYFLKNEVFILPLKDQENLGLQNSNTPVTMENDVIGYHSNKKLKLSNSKNFCFIGKSMKNW